MRLGSTWRRRWSNSMPRPARWPPKRSSPRWRRCCGPTARKLPCGSPTTSGTGWSPPCSPRTLAGRCGWPTSSTPGWSGSTRPRPGWTSTRRSAARSSPATGPGSRGSRQGTSIPRPGLSRSCPDAGTARAPSRHRPGPRGGAAMCTDQTPAAHQHPAGPQVLRDFDPGVVFDLEPVDAVTVTTLMDNVTDVFMPDQGPARRPPGLSRARLPVSIMEDGDAPDPLLAEHGFSVLVTVTRNGSEHHLLFDAGTSPDGVV